MIKRRNLTNYAKKWSYLIELFGERCVYCNKNIATQIDHVIPYSHEAYHGIDNLRPCCVFCNMIAYDRIFNDFTEKYDFIQKKLKEKQTLHMLLCSVCLIPFYSALHSSFIFCPRCYAKEYEIEQDNKKEWRDWIEILAKAKVEFRAHYALADEIYEDNSHCMLLSDKIELLVRLAETYSEKDKFNEYTLNSITDLHF